jgi:hypothetical protein
MATRSPEGNLHKRNRGGEGLAHASVITFPHCDPKQGLHLCVGACEGNFAKLPLSFCEETGLLGDGVEGRGELAKGSSQLGPLVGSRCGAELADRPIPLDEVEVSAPQSTEVRIPIR